MLPLIGIISAIPQELPALRTLLQHPVVMKTEGQTEYVQGSLDGVSVVVRTISDRADHSAIVDFPAFVEHVASRYALALVTRLVPRIARRGAHQR